MFKKVFFIAAMLISAISINSNAQHLQSQKFNFRKAVPMYSVGAVTSNLPLNDNEYWWGYFDGTLDNVQMIGMGSNSQIPQAYMGATCYPAGTKELKERTIEGMSFSFPSSKNITDVKVWISEDLPESAEKATHTYQSVSTVTGYNVEGDQINEVRFDNPYTVDPAKDVYVGYSFVVSKDEGQFDQYPVFVTGIGGHNSGLNVKVGADGQWIPYDDYGFGDLAVRVLLGGGNFEQNSVSVVKTFNDVAATKGSEVVIPVEVQNQGGNGFENIDVTIDINGVKKQMNLKADRKVAGVGTRYTFDLKTEAPAESGTFPVAITVDKVNGVANNCTQNTMKGNLIVISRIVDRRVMFEEFTATWCGFCPRGAVGIEKAEQVYGDKIVPICVHYQDEMGNIDYTQLIKATVEGFPSSHLNRTFMDVDPYFGKSGNVKFGIKDLIDQCMADVPVAEVLADASVEGDVVTAKADVRFLFSGDVACAVGFILTADGLQNEAWWQGNNYSGAKGFSDEPLFDKWVNADKKAEGVVYNDVVIAGIGVEKGYNQCVITKAVEEEPNKYEVKFNLKDYPIIQDKSKLNVSVFLYDRKTNRIINVGRKAVDASTGIENINSDEASRQEVARYSVDGRRIYGAEKGINIVKYSDGNVKKVVVK